MSTPDTMTTLVSAPWFDADGNRKSWRKNLALGTWAVTAVCAAAPEAMANDLLGSTSNVWAPAAAYGLTLLTAWGSSKK